MASAMTFRLEQRVSIAGKGVGTIAFIGKTEFADGDWIGVILDEPKGKNNGTVPKKDGTTVRYFTCNDNHGLYVRPTQIESILNEPQTNLPRSTSVQSVKPPTTIPAGPAIPTGIPTTKPSALPAKPAAIRTPSGRSTGFVHLLDDRQVQHVILNLLTILSQLCPKKNRNQFQLNRHQI